MNICINDLFVASLHICVKVEKLYEAPEECQMWQSLFGAKPKLENRVSQKNQKSEFCFATNPSGFHRLDEPPEKISALQTHKRNCASHFQFYIVITMGKSAKNCVRPNMHLNMPNMVKWGVPEKILQKAVQTCWSYVNGTLQSKVMTKSNFWPISPL